MQTYREYIVHMLEELAFIQRSGREDLQQKRQKKKQNEKQRSWLRFYFFTSTSSVPGNSEKQRQAVTERQRERDIQRHMCLSLSHQGFCSTRAVEGSSFFHCPFIVTSGSVRKSRRQRWGSSKERKKRCGGGNQMRQLHTGRKKDRLADDQDDGREFSLINRSSMSIQILSGWTKSDMKLVRLN